jgi:hypothetical protein
LNNTTNQIKTKQIKSNQIKTKQNKKKQIKTIQNKSNQNKTKQNKTNQNKTKQGPGACQSEQSRRSLVHPNTFSSQELEYYLKQM